MKKTYKISTTDGLGTDVHVEITGVKLDSVDHKPLSWSGSVLCDGLRLDVDARRPVFDITLVSGNGTRQRKVDLTETLEQYEHLLEIHGQVDNIFDDHDMDPFDEISDEDRWVLAQAIQDSGDVATDFVNKDSVSTAMARMMRRYVTERRGVIRVPHVYDSEAIVELSLERNRIFAKTAGNAFVEVGLVDCDGDDAIDTRTLPATRISPPPF